MDGDGICISAGFKRDACINVEAAHDKAAGKSADVVDAIELRVKFTLRIHLPPQLTWVAGLARQVYPAVEMQERRSRSHHVQQLRCALRGSRERK